MIREHHCEIRFCCPFSSRERTYRNTHLNATPSLSCRCNRATDWVTMVRIDAYAAIAELLHKSQVHNLTTVGFKCFTLYDRLSGRVCETVHSVSCYYCRDSGGGTWPCPCSSLPHVPFPLDPLPSSDRLRTSSLSSFCMLTGVGGICSERKSLQR